MTLKIKSLFATLSLGIQAFPASSNVVTYDISVAGGTWYGGLSWGIPGLPINGSISVDNIALSISGFSLTAGPSNWSQQNFTTAPGLSFDSFGSLTDFNLPHLSSGNYQMSINSSNSFELFDGNNVASCTGCVHFSPSALPVPEPGGGVLLSAGIALFVLLGLHRTRAAQ